MSVRRTALAGAILAALGIGARVLTQQRTRFDHPKHARLFVTCATCHAGAERAGAPLMPAAASCAACHDGRTEARVEWSPRAARRESNLRFDHLRHAQVRLARRDSTESCTDCHADRGARWMQVSSPSAPQCLGCHAPASPDHLAQPDTACQSCHLPLARASALTAQRIAAFPEPASHRRPGFLARGGHGAEARRGAPVQPVAASCATCHARDFCAACHVDAPEVAAIQALEPDPRSLAIAAELEAPASHRDPRFERTHGRQAARSEASCATCHTQESCLECHRAQAPREVLALARAGPGRGLGARTPRRAPASHVPGWREDHGPVAAATMASCTTCHARTECLTCHVPPASRRGGYHPTGYLTRHPADAYSRSASCADCHNTGEFCQQCHSLAGLTARRTLIGAAGYHDGDRQFLFGHGQAARQGLESCVSCHIERDCLTCHSVVGGRGFNPHGPGFDPQRMLKKNPAMCIACHGTAIPRRP